LASGAKGRGFESRIAHGPFLPKEWEMADLSLIVEKLNSFLQGQGLEKLTGTPADAETLFTAVLRSVWKHPDKQQRENIAFTVIRELKKYFGGKNLEEIYTRITKELEADAAKQSEQQAKKADEDRKKDPNYVPSFDELFGK
jgi:hypothetical protein